MDCLLKDILDDDEDHLNTYFYEQASLIEKCYTQCLHFLGYNYQKEPIHQDYNLVLSRHFLFLVRRRSESVKDPERPKATINMNSLGFAGTMAVKNEESLEFIRELTPLGVLERLAEENN